MLTLGIVGGMGASYDETPLIGSRVTMMGGGKKWHNPYITDGLVAMWDGEWNVGGGISNRSATAWTDIVAGISFNLTGVLWGEKNAIFNGDGYGLCDDSGMEKLQTLMVSPISYEVVFKNLAVNNYSNIFGLGGDNIFGNRASTLYLRGYGNAGGIVAPQCAGVISSSSSRKCVTVSGYPMFNNGMELYDNSVAGTFERFASRPISNYGRPKIGCGEGSDGIKTRFFTGEINCIRLYSRALTAAEIAENYAIDKARFNI